MSEAAPHLIVRSVSKRYGPTTVLDHIDLTIRRGELVTLLGPSGCGKTTLLRAIAGLAQPDAGKVELAGRDITNVPPHRRNVGVVFQSYALFPHLTVAGNVAFGLKVRGAAKREIDAAVERALSLVKLGHLGGRRISALSGGQQQRVALARAIAVEPDVLLFDEALSALDRKLREEMQVELRRLLQEVKATAIFVTHDQDEALTMSDRVAVMNKGRIEQLAEPRQLYLRPASLFTLNFVGLSTRISGTVLAADNGKVDVETKLGRLSALGNFQAGSPVIVAARPEQLRLGEQGATNSAAGRVRSVVFQGSRTLVEVDAGAGESLLAELSERDGAIPHVHDEIRLSWPIAETFAFPMEAQA
ncbi:putative spermidine/putrescine transport system ATP-binding protein [Bradyrhizobium sp. F1.4.3]|uniref:ABC transporter ATP-binding protein n=1 Tax=Bradyrhizobium sp. F1.4.3 TaxID=3156356 RepID=UPI00339AF082